MSYHQIRSINSLIQNHSSNLISLSRIELLQGEFCIGKSEALILPFGHLTHRQEQHVTKTTMVQRQKSNSVTSSQTITPKISVQSLLYVLPKECAILIVLQGNFSTAASSRKGQYDIYNSGTSSTKFVEGNQSKYEKDTIIRQASNRRDQVVVLVY